MTAHIIPKHHIKLKRAYEKAEPDDGLRLLVDRLWPRGLSKAKAKIDRWVKEIAPSTELRQWFGHDPARWLEFRRRYKQELRPNAAVLDDIRALAKKGIITLVYSAHDDKYNNAAVLEEVLFQHKTTK